MRQKTRAKIFATCILLQKEIVFVNKLRLPKRNSLIASESLLEVLIGGIVFRGYRNRESIGSMLRILLAGRDRVLASKTAESE